MITTRELVAGYDRYNYRKDNQTLADILRNTSTIVDELEAHDASPMCEVCGRQGTTFDRRCRAHAPMMVNPGRRSTDNTDRNGR